MPSLPSDSRRPGDAPASPAWFCLRTQPKHEHIAARHLRQMQGVEVLNPRLRFTRATRYGPVWVTESLFPNYLFARFDLMAGLNRIQYAPGVNTVVHFGDRWPTVPDGVIEEIRTRLGPESVHVVPNEFEPGEKAVLCAGAFQGLEVVITQALPGRKRVEVLLDFLGRQTSVIVSPNSLVKQTIRF